MNPKITMIMPVYNTEKYLEKAIKSVIEQTFENFEFLIVNNGCTDGSGSIIEHYASINSRIRVITNEQNQLISEARNVAISQATGDYICFIDSDDWIEPNMLEDMVHAADTNNSDLVIVGFYMEYYQQNRHTSYPVLAETRDYSINEFKKDAHVLLNKTLLAVPWNKLYRLSNIKEYGIHFRNTKWEDHHFNMDFLKDCKSISVIGKAYYHYYRSRPGSDSEIVYDKQLYKKRREHFTHTLEVYKYWNYWDDETEVSLANYYSGRMVQCVQEASSYKGMSFAEKMNKIREIINDELTVSQVGKAKPKSLMMKICIMPIKWKNAFVCYFFGNAISFVKNNFSNFFYKIRAKQAQGADKL